MPFSFEDQSVALIIYDESVYSVKAPIYMMLNITGKLITML